MVKESVSNNLWITEFKCKINNKYGFGFGQVTINMYLWFTDYKRNTDKKMRIMRIKS